MTYAAHHSHFAPYFADKASPKSSPKSNAVAKRRGVLRRIFDAMVESRQKQADQKIARWLGRVHH